MNTRNQPCPCESGLKFKHCCLPLRTAKTPDQRVDATVNQIERLSNAYGGELVADVIREMQGQGQIKPFWGGSVMKFPLAVALTAYLAATALTVAVLDGWFPAPPAPRPAGNPMPLALPALTPATVEYVSNVWILTPPFPPNMDGAIKGIATQQCDVMLWQPSAWDTSYGEPPSPNFVAAEINAAEDWLREHVTEGQFQVCLGGGTYRGVW